MTSWKVPSKSRPGLEHEVAFDYPDWSCTCEKETFVPGEGCSHIKLIRSRMNNEKLKPNEYLLAISGKTPVENLVELDEMVTFGGKGQVVKVEHLTRQDGTYDVILVVKPIEVYVKKDTS